MARKSKKRRLKQRISTAKRDLYNIPSPKRFRRPSIPKGKIHARSPFKSHIREFFLFDQFPRNLPPTAQKVQRKTTRITPRTGRSYLRDTINYRSPEFRKECIDRKARKTSLFATGKAGKGKRITGPKRITPKTQIRCK